MNEHLRSERAHDKTWSDPDAAVAFLKQLRATGPWTLSAIYPSNESPRQSGDVGPVPTRTFNEAKVVRKWIVARSGVANLYFTPNVAAAISKKPSKADIQDVQFAHVDVDEDENGPLAGDDSRKNRVLDKLNACKVPGPPSFVIDSGGGLQAIWAIGPGNDSDEAKRDCEGINRKFIERFGGDPTTWNIDRLLRLPGTVNIPNQKKMTRGRVAAPAKLVEANGARYERFEFESDDAQPDAPEIDVNFGPITQVEDLDELGATYDLPKRVMTIIRDGRLSKPKKPDNSRSVWLFDAVCGLVRARVPNEVVLGIITDERFAISESVLEKDDADDYAERQVRSALSKLHLELETMTSSDANEADAGDQLWPRQLPYIAGKQGNNARNGRIFNSKRPQRIVTSDGVFFSLQPEGIWVETKESALRAEIRATNPKDTLQVHDIAAMVKAIADLTHTTARPFEWIDPPPQAPAPKDLVLFGNGVLNIRTDELLQLDGSYFATALPGFDYDWTASCPNWLAWLDERLDTSFHPTLQEWMGYVMVPDSTAHRFATFTGPPRSGKSTCKNIIEHLVGTDHIARKQLADMGKEFGLQDAIDKRLIVIPDAKDVPGTQRGQALERILAVTGGDISGVPRKYLPAVSVKLLTRLLVLGNRQPSWIDESGALAARQIAIVFDRSFEGKEDQGVEDGLIAELPGIANWALDGLQRLRANQYKFTIGEAGQAAVAEVRRTASPALRFAEDCLEVTGNLDDMVLVDDVYEVYEMWTSGEGTYSRNKTELMIDISTTLHNVRVTQTRKLPKPITWKGGEYRPRVLQGVKSARLPGR